MKDYYSRETLFFKFVNQGHHPSHLPPPSLFLPYSFSHFSPFITYYLQFVHLCPPLPLSLLHYADCPPCRLPTQVFPPSSIDSLFTRYPLKSFLHPSLRIFHLGQFPLPPSLPILVRPPRSSYHSSHSPAHSFFIDYLRGDNFDMTQQHILNMTQILADLG